jgi:hypothetical protein
LFAFFFVVSLLCSELLGHGKEMKAHVC